MNTSPQQALEASRLKFAKIGILIAVLSGASWGFQAIIMGKAGSLYPFADPSYGVWMICLASLATGAIHDICAGVWITIYNLMTGRGFKEYVRLLKTKVGRLIVIGAIFGGPCAAGCYLMAINLCGPTYAAGITATFPVLGTLLSVHVLKEKLNKRVWAGIIIAVAGAFIVGYAPPDGNIYPNFYLGIAFAATAAVFQALEGNVVTYANDMADPNVSVGVYRTYFSGLFYIVLLIPIFGWFVNSGMAGWDIMGKAVALGTPIVWIALAALGGGTSYVTLYTAMNMTGVGRATSINITYALWTIVFGLLFKALGIVEYSVTTQAIIGVLVIVVGAIFVVANPKELLQLRQERME